MDRTLCKLTLIYPPNAEDRLIEFMLDQAILGFGGVYCPAGDCRPEPVGSG